MTSFIIKTQLERQNQPWKDDSFCAFCKIVSGELQAFRVYENDKVIAILDIMPLRRGHTLVIPKAHYSRLSELPPDFAAAVGEAVSSVANALTHAVENTALNVVCNQEYAQAVPHVHYHIIPAPQFDPPGLSTTKPSEPAPPSQRRMHQLEFEARNELEDEDAYTLVKKMRARL